MRILVADDDANYRYLLGVTLEKAGFEVVPAGDGREAWDVLSGEDPPPMAILDWIMPEIDGIEIVSRVRARKSDRHPYLIIVTVRHGKDDIVAGLDAGADDYLVKPFEQEELVARVRVGERMVKLENSLAERIQELEGAQTHIKQLEGLLPICSFCKKIRDDSERWHKLERYIGDRSGVSFSHGLCPECRQKHYPNVPTRQG